MYKSNESIPHYALYGENTSIEDIEFVHIEDIVSRSKLYDWEIGVHSHNTLLQVMIVEHGRVEMVLDNRREHLVGPCLVLIPAGAVHGFHFDPETKGKILSVAAAFMETNSQALGQGLQRDLFSRAQVLSYENNSKRFDEIIHVASQIHKEFNHLDIGRAVMFDALLHVLFVHVQRDARLSLQEPEEQNRDRDLFRHFRQLIDQHFKERRLVADYAQDLFVTESKLNRVCLATVEKTAFEVLQDRVSLEAQRYLIYTAAPLAKIAYDLGFNDSAYFCRYFKKRTGKTPKAFRQSYLHESS